MTERYEEIAHSLQIGKRRETIAYGWKWSPGKDGRFFVELRTENKRLLGWSKPEIRLPTKDELRARAPYLVPVLAAVGFGFRLGPAGYFTTSPANHDDWCEAIMFGWLKSDKTQWDRVMSGDMTQEEFQDERYPRLLKDVRRKIKEATGIHYVQSGNPQE